MEDEKIDGGEEVAAEVEPETIGEENNDTKDAKDLSENTEVENDSVNGTSNKPNDEEGNKEVTERCEVIEDESTGDLEKPEEGEGDESLLQKSNICDDTNNLDTSEVITVDDTNDGDVPSKTVPDVVFFDSVSDEEKKFYEENGPTVDSVETMNIQCTACWKQVNHHVMNNIMRHPLLGVAVCRNCRYFYEGDDNSDEWEKDEEGSDLYCRWCAQGGEVVGCDKCQYVFCKRCITRNLGRKKFAEINDSEEWSCFCCDPSQIYKERALMFAVAKWAADRKNKKRMKDKLKLEKKKSDILKKNELEKKRREAKKKETERRRKEKEG